MYKLSTHFHRSARQVHVLSAHYKLSSLTEVHVIQRNNETGVHNDPGFIVATTIVMHLNVELRSPN